MPGMNADIEKFRFFSNISKTDKAEWDIFIAVILSTYEKAMRKGVGDLSEKHIL
jgi:hypothetical protein